MARVVFVDSATEIPKSDIVGLDIETFPNSVQTDNPKLRIDPRLSELVLAQVAVGDDVYILTRNFESLKGLLEDPTVLKVIHSASFECKHLLWSIKSEIRNLVDVAILEGLIEAGRSRKRGLKLLAEKYLGVKLDKEVRELFVQGRKLNRGMIEYAAKDAQVLVPIYQRQQEKYY